MGWSRNLGVALAAALVALRPGTLSAQSQSSNEPERIEVVSLAFKGVKAVDVRELRKNIDTEASHCTSAILIPICWITHGRLVYQQEYLDRPELARDILRLRVFYWKRGYRETAVDTVVAKRADDEVAVTFNVNEGSPTMVRTIGVEQTTDVLSQREIDDRLILGANSPLNLIRLDSSIIFLQQRLWDKGYADALVDTSVVVDTATKTATVRIDLDPRWRATVADILIEGNDQISSRTIRNSLTLRPGDLFRRSELLRSQRILYESNLFRRASIDIPRQGDSAKVLIVNVQEAPQREARLSAGFSTVDFFQTEGRFTHYNMFGGARRFDAIAAVGNLFARSLNGKSIFRNAFENVSTDRDKYFAPTYNASVNLRQPWFQARENELALGLFAHRRSAPGIYVDRGFGLSATFTREILERAYASANYRFERTRVDAGDLYFCVNFGICDRNTLDALKKNQKLSPFTISTGINRADAPLSPTRGYRATADFEHASAFTFSDFRYNRATTDAAMYYPVRKRGTLAGHVRIGWVRGLASTSEALAVETDDALLHPRKRFYAGGSRSVRGYGENQLGPRVLTIPASKLRENDPACASAADIRTCDPNVEGLDRLDFETRPLGGNFVAETSAEFRFPLWRQIFGAAFIDAGYVSQRTNPELPTSKAAITPGFGVRYRSPVGPIRVDLGINPGLSETLPVLTDAIIDGEKRLVTLDERRRFKPVGRGAWGILDRMVLHLSIGEAF
jgi:outer membrane protein insertion porin family/translocation and assembly module TamA